MPSTTPARTPPPEGCPPRTSSSSRDYPDQRQLEVLLWVNIASLPAGSVLYHTGQVFGYEALFAYYPDSGANLAFLINSDGTLPGRHGSHECPLRRSESPHS